MIEKLLVKFPGKKNERWMFFGGLERKLARHAFLADGGTKTRLDSEFRNARGPREAFGADGFPCKIPLLSTGNLTRRGRGVACGIFD